jgi:hypothetical protein
MTLTLPCWDGTTTTRIPSLIVIFSSSQSPFSFPLIFSLFLQLDQFFSLFSVLFLISPYLYYIFIVIVIGCIVSARMLY